MEQLELRSEAVGGRVRQASDLEVLKRDLDPHRSPNYNWHSEGGERV